MFKSRLFRISFGIIFLLNFMLIGCSSTGGTKKMGTETSSFEILNQEQLPIGMWVTPPNDKISNETYKEMKDSGINIVLGFREETTDNILAAMDAAHENGMKFLVYEPRIRNLIDQYFIEEDAGLIEQMNVLISRYADHPAYAGQLLVDEPGKPQFKAVNAFMDAYMEAYPNKLPYVNLFPTYATGGIRTDSYEDYITSWLQDSNMPFLSFDFYPLLENGEEMNDYYYNLSIVRDKTAEKGIPFWTFVQTLQYGNTPGVPNHREPSEADIRWQVFSNLAFGAKAIQYFTYWTPGSGQETFGDAMIDSQGNKTPRYDYVKKVNEDIYEIGKILMKSKSLGVIPYIKSGDFQFELYSKLDRFQPVSHIEGDSVIMGCFEGADGRMKAMIVNATPHRPATIKIHLNDVNEFSYWIQGKKQTLQINTDVIEMTINSGDGVFIEF